MTSADLNRARVLALRLLRESGWAGPARVAVEVGQGRLRIVAEPAAEPLTDSPPPAPQEVNDVEKLAKRIRDRAAGRS